MSTDTARPDLLDMAREIGVPDSRASATFSAATATFDGLATAVGAGPDASFEVIEAGVMARLRRGKAAEAALALVVDALGNDDAPEDPDAVAAWATLRINGMQDTAAQTEWSSRHAVAAQALADVGELLEVDAGAAPAVVLLEAQQRLRAGAAARAVLVGVAQSCDFPSPDEREPVNDGRYLTDLMVAIRGSWAGGNGEPTPARGIDAVARRVADINREALDEIAAAVMGPNPDAAGVPAERLVSPYAHEVVTAVRALVADRESWRSVARKVVDALNEHPSKGPGQPERLLWPAIELGTGPSLFDEVAEVVGEVVRWQRATRHVLSRTVMDADGAFVRPEAVLAENLTPQDMQSRIGDLLEGWFRHGTAMLRATAAPSSDTSAMWGRRPGVVADRVVSTLTALRRDYTQAYNDHAQAYNDHAQARAALDACTEELTGARAELAAVPIERGSRFAGVLALLSAAAKLDPTRGGTRLRVIPAHDPTHLGPLWDERVRLTGWLIERAEAAARTEGERA